MRGQQHPSDFIYEHVSDFNKSELDMQRLFETQKNRRRAYQLLALFLPYYWLKLKWITWTSKKSSGKRKIRIASYLRQFYKRYFIFKGMQPFIKSPLPKELEHPCLILTTRVHSFAPFFIYSLMKDTLIIPVLEGFELYKPHPKISIEIGQNLKTISYPDTGLSSDLSNIKKLLNAGYPTLVHINHTFANPDTQKTLYIVDAVLELLKEDVPIYLLNIENFDQYPYANFLQPLLINVKLEELKTMIGTDTSKEAYLRSITSFFGFVEYELTKVRGT